jgi:hypothetical protein
MMLWRRLADSAAIDAVRSIERINFFHQFGLNIKTVAYGLVGEIMRIVGTGISDKIVQLESKDISQTTVEERIATAERLRLERQAEIAHQEEENRRVDIYRRQVELIQAVKGQAEEASYALLMSRLNEQEKAEAIAMKRVTVQTETHGNFIVPIDYGHVHQFIDNRCVASYCLVFEDPLIPIYDIVLMKILLLKNDPEHFIKTANNFIPTHRNIVGDGDVNRILTPTGRRRRRRRTV